MTGIPAGIAAEAALAQQAVALSVLKQSAQAQAQIANMLQDAIVPVSSRGGIVNISA